MTSAQAERDAVDVCPYCGGYGEIFGHAPDCDNDDCVLAGGIDDCLGQVDECPACAGDHHKGTPEKGSDNGD